jgi:hypothetical protein
MTRRERDLRRLARARGWRLERTRKHWRLIAPTGEIVTTSATPSSTFIQQMLRAEMARAERRSR